MHRRTARGGRRENDSRSDEVGDLATERPSTKLARRSSLRDENKAGAVRSACLRRADDESGDVLLVRRDGTCDYEPES